MRNIYKRIIGLIMCLPFAYALYFCTFLTKLDILARKNLSDRILHITACIIGGSSVSIIVLIAFAFGLYFLLAGGGKDE